MLETGSLKSIDVGRAALRLALSSSRTEEQFIKESLLKQNIRSAAVDFGGEFVPSIRKIMERAGKGAALVAFLKKEIGVTPSA